MSSRCLSLLETVDILACDVGEFGDEGRWERSIASILEATEVAAGHIKKGEVSACLVVFRIEYHQFE